MEVRSRTCPRPSPPVGSAVTSCSRAVAEGTAGAVGDEFLRCLAQHVAEAFAAKMVLIVEADDPSGMHVKTLVSWYDGAFIEEPFEYDTAGTPCAVATDYPWVSFPEALNERFPKAEIAINLGLQSYLAVCLKSSDDVHLGHLAVLDDAADGGGRAGRRGAADLRRARVRRARAPQPGAGAGGVARARDRGGRQGAPPRRARPARRRAAAAARGLEPAARLAHEARRGRPRVRPDDARRGRARAGACGAAQARPRPASGCAARARARAGAGVAVPGLRRADRGRRLRGRAPAAARARRLLRRRGVARQRRALRAGEPDRRADREGGGDAGGRGARRRRRRRRPREAGPGCSGLDDRVDVLGGRLEVDSPAGGGTLVRATIPL